VLQLAMINLSIPNLQSVSTRYEDTGYERWYKMWNMWWFGVIQGRSLEIAPFDK